MADWPLPDHGGRTPLELAKTPAMDRVTELGVLGQFYPIPDGLPPGSDVGNLSVFGYDPAATFSGRAAIEAANQGITLAENEVAFRCNLVTLADQAMVDFTSGHITSQEGAQAVSALNEALGREFPVVFHPGVSYRHLAIVTDSDLASTQAMVDMTCTPPHDITGEPWEPHMPQGVGAELICGLMRRSQEILPTLPVNAKRIEAGHRPANSAWFWGQGKALQVDSYAAKYGITGAVISAVDLVMGIGVCAGLEVIRVPGATGWIDTNYEGKINAALEALEQHDFVYLHVEATDEAAHQGNVKLKVQAIEDFDYRIVAPAVEYYFDHRDTRLLVAPDHFTTIETRTHESGPVPFAVCGQGITPNGATSYSEAKAEATGLLIEAGHTLTERFIRENPLQL